MDSTSGRRSATDLDQLRWTAEARIPVPGFRHALGSAVPLNRGVLPELKIRALIGR
jgi:hypothetical protein